MMPSWRCDGWELKWLAVSDRPSTKVVEGLAISGAGQASSAPSRGADIFTWLIEEPASQELMVFVPLLMSGVV